MGSPGNMSLKFWLVVLSLCFIPYFKGSLSDTKEIPHKQDERNNIEILEKPEAKKERIERSMTQENNKRKKIMQIKKTRMKKIKAERIRVQENKKLKKRRR